jgi:threonine dehydratase
MIKQNIDKASARIKKFIQKTPFEKSEMISKMVGAEVWLKMENQQYTGSFKFRGAMNKMLTLENSQLESGIYAASTGNHGAAVAYACQILNVPCIVYVPEKSSEAKLANMKNFGAEIRVHGEDCMEGELKAREVATRTGAIYVSPYNDADIVYGQGTIGEEIQSQCEGLDAIIVSVGGGGLISGVGGYLKSIWPNIEVIAASPENHAVMIKSLEQGEIVKINPKPTISDGTAGGVEEGSITFDYCQNFVDHSILLSEKEIEEGLIHILEKERVLVEGAAGTSVAALIKMKNFLKGKKVGIILCGKNISMDVLRRIL